MPLSIVGARERRALANVLMIDGMEAIASLLNPQPPKYISHFDRLLLTGGVVRSLQLTEDVRKPRAEEPRYSLQLIFRAILPDGGIVDVGTGIYGAGSSSRPRQGSYAFFGER